MGETSPTNLVQALNLNHELTIEVEKIHQDQHSQVQQNARLEAELATFRQQVAERDTEWSVELESGFSDCPPRNPSEVGKWWKRHFADVDRNSRTTVAAELSALTPKDYVALRKVILGCNEQVWRDGGCECTYFIGAKMAELEAENATLQQQVAELKNGWNSEKKMREANKQSVVDTIQGHVESQPTHTGNYLQRLRELVKTEGLY